MNVLERIFIIPRRGSQTSGNKHHNHVSTGLNTINSSMESSVGSLDQNLATENAELQVQIEALKRQLAKHQAENNSKNEEIGLLKTQLKAKDGFIARNNQVQDIMMKSLMSRVRDEVTLQTQELETANKSLAEANQKIVRQSQNQLKHFAMMSHEIRTPLNCIVGLSNLLLDETGLDAEVHESLEMITTSGDLLLAVVDDVLDYAKLATGKVETIIQPTNVQKTINAVICCVRPKAKDKNLVLRPSIHLPDALFETDGRRLQQILYNLLGNAVKFGAGGQFVDFTVEVTRSNIGESFIKFSIKDYGKGIEPDEMEKIFEPFQQATTNEPSVHGGTGLGLAITRQLVRVLGGNIGVQSVYGEWCEFSFTIPMRSGAAGDCQQTTHQVALDEDYDSAEWGESPQYDEFSASAPSSDEDDDEDDDDGSSVCSSSRCSSSAVSASFLKFAHDRKVVPSIPSAFKHMDEYSQSSSNARSSSFRRRISCDSRAKSPAPSLSTPITTTNDVFTKIPTSVDIDSMTVLSPIAAAPFKPEVTQPPLDDPPVFAPPPSLSATKSASSSLSPAMPPSNALVVAATKTTTVTTANISTPNTTTYARNDVDSNSKTLQDDDKPQKQKGPGQKAVGEIRALIAEDNLVNQKVLQRTLNRIGILQQNIVVVDNGQKAVDSSANQKYDIIFMDLQMPVMDGLEATRIISQRRQALSQDYPRIVFLTAHALQDFQDKAAQVGGDGFISKPFKMDVIKDLLKEIH